MFINLKELIKQTVENHEELSMDNKEDRAKLVKVLTEALENDLNTKTKAIRSLIGS